MFRFVPVILTLSIVWACKPDDEKVFQNGSNLETKPAATAVEGLLGGDLTKKATEEAATVTYSMRILSNSGAELCAGETTLVVMTDFSLEVPESKIHCASLTVDLAGILASGSGLGGGGGMGSDNLSHDGHVLALREMAGATFDPPRPFLLGPIVQDVDKYKDFKRSTKHSLTAESDDGPVTGQGTFHIEVLDHHTTYGNAHIDETFDNVLHWRMRTSGFEGVQAKHGLIFDEWEWVWNTRPIMIPSITITGRLSDFVASNDGVGDKIVGQITVKLVVKNFAIKGTADLR